MKSKVALIAGILVLAALPLLADVYYEVGPSQTYATIQDALNATPFLFDGSGNPIPFTENHIINIHAGTYGTFNTDYYSKLNYKPSRTSKDKRLIIQAVPGDEVVVVGGGYSNSIRESFVTIQGIKFTGLTPGPNQFYMQINSETDNPAWINKGGIILYNNEFVGAYPNYSQYSTEENTDFTIATINNYIHDLEFHYWPWQTNMFAGNVVARWGTLGGGGVFLSDWTINNTFFTEGNLSGVPYGTPAGDLSGSTLANNIVVKKGGGDNNGRRFDNPVDLFPTMSNNLQYGNLDWAGVQGARYWSIAAFNAAIAGKGVELNGLQVDPLFVNEAGGDYRLQAISPANGTGSSGYWTAAMTDLGIGGLLGYWNPVRDIGYDLTHSNRGALQTLVLIPEPAAFVLLALGLAGLLRRR